MRHYAIFLDMLVPSRWVSATRTRSSWRWPMNCGQACKQPQSRLAAPTTGVILERSELRLGLRLRNSTSEC